MSEANEVVMIYVPCGCDEEAARVARALLDERLIACANIYPSRSIYRWKGELAEEQESVLICKTTAARARAAEKVISEMHSYEVPCILRVRQMQANRAFASWVAGEVAGSTLPAGAGG